MSDLAWVALAWTVTAACIPFVFLAGFEIGRLRERDER